MLRAISFTLLGLITLIAYADGSECSKLTDLVDGSGNNYRPPLEAIVTGNGRLYFYSAPSTRCPIEGVFVIKGDVLTAYRSFNGWVNVMYIAKNGDDFVGWVPENRIKKIGPYGHNP